MKNYRLMVGLALAGSIALVASPYVLPALAAGLFPNFPIVGVATYCGGSLSTATGTLTGVQTGCPNQVPAGPTVVTGSETIPADTNLSSGANPQTVLLSLASLNALPILVQASTVATAPVSISASNLSGGVIFTSTVVITKANVTLPSAPIDGQQYAISSNRNINVLEVSAGTNTVGNVNPISLTNQTSGSTSGQPVGFRWMFNRASTTWLRLQ